MSAPRAEDALQDGPLPEEEALLSEENEARSAAPPQPPRWPRRIAPLVLLAGAVLAASTFFGRMPREREIELKLSDATAVRGLDVTWTDARSVRGAADETPLQGSSWHFVEGTAPRSLRTTVRLPDGSYNLEIGVDRTAGQDTTRRVVTLGDADRISVPVR